MYSASMSEQVDLTAKLRAGGVLDGVRWAFGAAVSRTLADYSEDAGHDAAWLGSTRFVLFRDRLDRVFTCGKYALQIGDDSSTGIDLVCVELTERDIETMPSIAPGLVRRGDLNHSPGWLFEGVRFLLASCEFGKIDAIPWPQKSLTKQAVANQPNPEPPPTLFDGMAEGEVGGLAAIADDSEDFDTFVVAHTLDSLNHKGELVFGRPRLNEGGGDAWYWHENLLTGPSPQGGKQEAPKPIDPDSTPDAPVRLRRKPGQRTGGAELP